MVVRVEKNGPVTTVINDRPEARNAGNPETADALTEAFLAFDADKSAKVAVFWGAGGSFCAGWDLKYGASLTGERHQREIVEALAFPHGSAPAPRGPLGPSRLELNKPVIAAVEGPAVAGGMELAMWADIRICAEDAFFGVYCRRWGIPLSDGGAVRLPRLVGMGRAMEIMLTGRKVTAEEAYRIGLCEKVVPSGQARTAAEEMAHEIARFPQGAMNADRRTAYETHGLSIREALKREWANAIGSPVRIREPDTGEPQGARRFASGLGRHGDFGKI